MLPAHDLDSLTQRFGLPDASLVLMGSHARGNAGPYSDLDLVRFLPGEGLPSDDGSYVIGGRLVVVSSVAPASVERWFNEPQEAVKVIAGLRSARAISDPWGWFAKIQARARAFTWDEAMTRRAEAWIAEQMVGWAEEAHKGLEGLRRDDAGRLLNARFGLSWGLARVLLVRHGILLTGDNSFYSQLRETLGSESAVVMLLDRVFGISLADGETPLRQQVRAGLELYVMTAEDACAVLDGRQAQVVDATARLIRQALGGSGS